MSIVDDFRAEYDPSKDWKFSGVSPVIRGVGILSPFGFKCGNGRLTFSPSVTVGRDGTFSHPVYSPFSFSHSILTKEGRLILFDQLTGICLIIDRILEPNASVQFGDERHRHSPIGKHVLLGRAGGIYKIGDKILSGAVSITLCSTGRNCFLAELFAEAHSDKRDLDDDTDVREFCLCSGMSPEKGRADLEKFRRLNEVKFLNRYAVRMYSPDFGRIITYYDWYALFR